MRIRRLIPHLIALALVGCMAGCSSSGTALQSGSPDKGTVEKAAGLAFGTRATCGQPDHYREYVCTEHPSTCGAQTDGYLDSSVPGAGCWQTVCDVTPGVTAAHGESGTKDFYYCERTVAGCTSMTGGCPYHDICITGTGRRIAVDADRTYALPGSGNGGSYFSCPYHDEG